MNNLLMNKTFYVGIKVQYNLFSSIDIDWYNGIFPDFDVTLDLFHHQKLLCTENKSGFLFFMIDLKDMSQ